MLLALTAALLGTASAADHRPPAGTRAVAVRPGAPSILPGGRVIAPIGKHYITGPGSFGLALNPKGTVVMTADGGPNHYSLTVVSLGKDGWHTGHLIAPRNKAEEVDDGDRDWRSVFMGLAFADGNEVYASEGETGRIRLVDSRNGKLKQSYDLNQGEFRDSYSGDLAYDSKGKRLYVLDQANFRLAIIDTVSRIIVSNVRVGRLPFSLALAPDGQRVYVAHIGMFEYRAVPGADPKSLRETGLVFPAFGFSSPESLEGARRRTGNGAEVEVPGLGDPNAPEANSVAVVDVSTPAKPTVVKYIHTGLPFGGRIAGGSSPSGVFATADHVFVSNGHNDSVTIIDTATLEAVADVPMRIPGLENYRGFLPIGLHYDPASKWLLVACAGINAVAVIDVAKRALTGLIPTAWFPTRVTVRDGAVWVSCAKGFGVGPNASRTGPVNRSFAGESRQGALVRFPLPGVEELARHTGVVFGANGFAPRPQAPAPLPDAIQHVVIILKEHRTFDEVLGDIETASNGPVAGLPILARFGRYGLANNRRGEFQRRLGLRNINITPNHHAMAQRFAFSDNFYADSDGRVDGHRWIVGSYPNAWTESTLQAAYGGQKQFRFPTTAPGRLLFAQTNSLIHPEEQLEAGALWHHLDRHGVSFRNFGDGYQAAGVGESDGLKPTGARYVTNVPMSDPLFRNSSRQYPNYNMHIPDQVRASQFIQEIDELYVKPGKPLPRLLFVHLPNDRTASPRPDDGYPFAASFVADNDLALGRMVEYLSHSAWWPKMAIFVAEVDAQGGVDHVDAHRTVFLALSPYAKPNYVSHVNSSFPGLLKTVFRLLRLPPLNLFDATAADLADCFQATPDLTPYKSLPVPAEVFEPETAKGPSDPQPDPRTQLPATV